jgi:exocyst complex protein 7
MSLNLSLLSSRDLNLQARSTLEEFEASISRDTVKHPPADGTVHPLAAYTLSFLKRLFAYEAAIDTLFGDAENEARHSSPDWCHSC